MPQNPKFTYEQQYWNQDIVVAGVDEAGMGALAGPVVAGAVIFRQGLNDQFLISNFQSNSNATKLKIVIRDSKTLSEKQRERGAAWIKENAVAWAIGEASVDDITEHNIRGASHLAMKRAIDALTRQPDTLLIDGPAFAKASAGAALQPIQPAEFLVKGDSKSFSIAAASILAKTHRDAIMLALDLEFPAYGFASHKGYGAAIHMKALQEHGACEHHRPTYAPVRAILA